MSYRCNKKVEISWTTKEYHQFENIFINVKCKAFAVAGNVYHSRIHCTCSTTSRNTVGLQRNRRYRSEERVRDNGTLIRTPMTHTSSLAQCGRNPHAEDASALEYLRK